MIRQFLSLTLGILLGPVISVQAQFAPEQIGFHLNTGAFKLVGGNADHSITNPLASIGLTLAISQRMDLQACADMGWVRPRSPDSYFQNHPNAPYRTYLFPWGIRMRCRLIRDRSWTPYIALGAGLIHWNLRNVSEEDHWFPIPQSGKSISGNQSNTTVLLAMGVSVFIAKSIALEVEGSYAHLLHQDLDNIGLNDVNTGIMTAKIGLGLYIGGKHDRDRDGILDEEDEDPLHPEDIDGYLDYDGRPDPDNDQDGIPDIIDKAPDLPEDIDGFQDEDGIPDLDNDGDGIPDVYDQAPQDPEDIDGFQDRDGIPDPDNDGDGIPDTEDPHPDMHEDRFRQMESPPEEGAVSTVLPGEEQPLILPEITFSTGSAALAPEALQMLRRVAASLSDHPGTDLEIRGFTDNTGSAMANLALSQRRADAVKSALTALGVETDRLIAAGYGQAMPVAPNATAEGRALNRRIEFYRIELKK